MPGGIAMKRASLVLSLLLVALASFSVPAFGWGSATHAYIANHLGTDVRPLNAQEMYGAMAPDMFQADLNLAFDPLLLYYTHGAPGQEGFMAIWSGARSRIAKAFALGWVSHNNVWGADSTAHDPSTGYVIQKAAALEAALGAAGVWTQVEQQVGFPLPLDDRLLFCHIVVETDGDLILRHADRGLAGRVIGAALMRSPRVPDQLADAMQGADPAVIAGMERGFRRYMLFYGAILAQNDADATRLMATDVARQALGYLAYVHPGLPVDQLKAPVEALSLLALQQAVPLLADYVPAVNDTVRSVSSQLALHGVPARKTGHDRRDH
jgi:hypothetical protein